MKAKQWLRNCLRSGLLLLLCALLVACTAPELPEESSSLPAESSEETLPVAEDPNAKAVRAYLDLLLGKENALAHAGEDEIEWIASDRAEEIRACVKMLKTPILTGEDVLSVADQAARFYLSAWEAEQTILLPACGVMRDVTCNTAAFQFYLEHADAYDALLAYTFYLFTPPDFLFLGSEVMLEGIPSFRLTDYLVTFFESDLYLPLAGAYTTRTGALAALRDQGNFVRLHPMFLYDGERPLDFSASYEAVDWVCEGEYTVLELDEMAARVTAESPFRVPYAQERLKHWLDQCTYMEDNIPISWVYGGNGTDSVYIPFAPMGAQEVREMAERLPSPLLTEWDVKGLAETFSEDSFGTWYAKDLPFRLPCADDEEILLDPDGMTLNERVRRVLAYTVDLFTPPAYRFTDLNGREGTYYALGESGWVFDVPEDALQSRTHYVLVTEEYELFLTDGGSIVDPLYTALGGGGADG